MRLKNLSPSTILLLIFPSLYFLLYWRVSSQRGPFFFNPNHDPAYAYLGNMLNIALSKMPQHTDHPGTPLQILGSIEIRAIHLIASALNLTSLPFSEHVLSQSELYLSILHFSFLLLAFLILGSLGFVTFLVTKDLLASCLLETVSVFLYPISHPQFFPEIILFAMAQAIGVLLILYLYIPGVNKKPWFLLSLGIMLGLGIAIKVTFLPFILLIGILPGITRKFVGIVIVAISFLVGTLPIASQYLRVITWLTRLTTRTGAYGVGEKSFIEPNFLSFLSGAFFQSPLFFLLYGFATIFLILIGLNGLRHFLKSTVNPSSFFTAFSNLYRQQEYSLHRHTLYLICLIVSVFWAQFIMTLGQNSGMIRYFFPSMALSQLLIFCLLIFIFQITSTDRNEKLKFLALLVCVIISFPNIANASTLAKKNASIIASDLNAIQNVEMQLSGNNCAVLDLQRSKPSTRGSALFFLSAWSGEHYAPILKSLEPNYLSLIIRRNNQSGNTFVSGFDLEMEPLSTFLQSSECTFIRYSYVVYTDDFSNVAPIVPELKGFTVKELYRGKVEALDRIERE